MSCDKYQERLPAFLDGDLSGPEKERLAEHLENCPDCRARETRLRKSLQIFTAVGQAEAPPTLPEGLPETIAALAREDRRPRNSWRAKLALAAMAALVVGLSAGYVLLPYFFGPETVAQKPAQLDPSLIQFKGESIGVEIGNDRFVLRTVDKQGRGEIDVKF